MINFNVNYLVQICNVYWNKWTRVWLFSCSGYIKVLFDRVLSTARMCGKPSSTYILDQVESKVFHLFNASHFTSQLLSFMFSRGFPSPLIFQKYYFGWCSEELNYCVPDTKNWERNTRLFSFLHEFCVEISHPRIDWYNSCFFPYKTNLWTSIPSSFLPSFTYIRLFFTILTLSRKRTIFGFNWKVIFLNSLE